MDPLVQDNVCSFLCRTDSDSSIANAVAPNLLWPPNHGMVLIQVSADVTDDCSPTTWKIVNVSSNEDANARGSGHTAPDWQICGDHSVKLRAERAGNGQGRVYSITLQATDGGGNVSAPSTVTVTVQI